MIYLNSKPNFSFLTKRTKTVADMQDNRDNNNNFNASEIVYSKKIRAGKRTYFIDVKPTRTDDYYITLTESKKRFRRSGGFYYEKHKVFLYKEDLNKLLAGLTEAIDHVKNELMPDYDFSQFDRDEDTYEENYASSYYEDESENIYQDDDVEDEVRSHLQWD